MKMKGKVTSIPYSLRKLILDKEVHDVIIELNSKRNSTEPVTIYLPQSDKDFEDLMCHPNRRETVDVNECFMNNDSYLIDELKRLGIITKKKDAYGWDDHTGSLYGILINEPVFIEHLNEWVKDSDKIISYQVFSLHTFTGEAYCLDNRYDFDTNDGLFRIFKAFLQESSHELSYQQIINFYLNDQVSDWDDLTVQQAIYRIKKRLGMKDLLLAADKHYYLRSLD
jgi:hypothetical protein